MSDNKIIELYKNRQFTIVELASLTGKPYKEVRKLIVAAGYQNGKLV